MRDTKSQFASFLKIRISLLCVTATIIATGTLGLVDLLSTTSIDAAPVYVHVTLGAAVFPLTVFVLEYRDADTIDAVRIGAGAALASVLLLLLLSEGAGRMTNGVLELGVPTLFYVATLSLVSATVIVVWVDRVYLDVPSPRGRNRDPRGRK